MIQHLKKLTLLAVLSVLLSFVIVSTGLGQITSPEVDALVQDAMEKFTVAGVAVGIVKDGEIIHAKGYGVRSIESREKVNKHTCFAIASNSKAFTTTALAILVEEGKISWQDRVISHIPEFRMYNDYVTQNFNIQDLVTHRSGLGLGAGDLQKWPSGSDFTISDMLTNFQYFEPVSAFRTKYDYDNILYLVAGELIKRVSGKSWEEFVKERIMDPLNMDNSYTLPPGMIETKNLATPHLAENGVLRTIPFYELDPEKINGAAGGVLANAEDLCGWMLLHLNEGKYGANLDNQLFTKESQREMWKIHTSIDVKPDPRYNPHFSGYGLGWRLSDLNGNLSVSHTGSLAGMLSKTIMIPDLNLGVVVLTNTYYGGAGVFRAVSQTIVDSYLGLDDIDWTDINLKNSKNNTGYSDSVIAKVWETVETADQNQIRNEDYLGNYKDRWFGKIEILIKDEQLWFESHRSPKLSGPMYYYKANAFAIKWKNREMDADAFALFSLDEEGQAIGLKMKGISPDIDFSYDFQDLSFRRVED